ncbi:MAG: succinylglutamate desuccinylase/aspartoacylase family protein [Rhodospirillales bacterium]|nr:succinylglutamate desuccinylase/aspartoacylase family protein [Rhodospirillales bacterium]
MANTPTRITTDIEFGRQGRQLGHLRLIHSDNRHAFSVIPIPIAVIANGSGPTILLTAGNHGDEYEGQALLHGLLRGIDIASIRGRLIVLPALNYPAVLAAARVSPLDDGNLNRAFPGDPDGSPTSAIAHYVETVLLSMVQGAADIHSGGSATVYAPSVYLHCGGGPDLLRRKLAGARAFGAPFTVCARATSDSRSMSAACDRLGVPMISTELAGGGTIDPEALAIGRAGLMRLLVHFGVVDGEPPADHRHATRLVSPTGPASSVMAPTEGIFEPLHGVGAEVRKGALAGYVHPIGELERPYAAMEFAHDGIVLVKRVPSLVRRGDYLYRLACEIDEKTLFA